MAGEALVAPVLSALYGAFVTSISLVRFVGIPPGTPTVTPATQVVNRFAGITSAAFDRLGDANITRSGRRPAVTENAGRRRPDVESEARRRVGDMCEDENDFSFIEGGIGARAWVR